MTDETQARAPRFLTRRAERQDDLHTTHPGIAEALGNLSMEIGGQPPQQRPETYGTRPTPTRDDAPRAEALAAAGLLRNYEMLATHCEEAGAAIVAAAQAAYSDGVARLQGDLDNAKDVQTGFAAVAEKARAKAEETRAQIEADRARLHKHLASAQALMDEVQKDSMSPP